jgi:hypothetical protein
MGLVKFGQGVAAISGKVGGSVFAHNKGGTYVRNWVKPTDPNTDRQSAVRQIMSDLMSHWNDNLTPDQREAWKTYAENVTVLNRFGDPITIPAISWFGGCNTQRVNATLNRIDDAPIIFNRGVGDDLIAVVASEATQQLSVSFNAGLDWVDEDQSALLVYCSRPQNPSLEFFRGPYRLTDYIEGDSVAPPGPPVVMDAPFPFVEAQKLFYRFVITRADARYTPSMFLSGLCVA